jgi:hypothetical protein
MPTSHVLWTGQPLAYPAVQKSGAAAETKCKMEETAITLRTIEESLSRAKEQLPERVPGVVFIKVPRHWIDDEEFAAKMHKLAERFLARSPWIVSVKFYMARIIIEWDEFDQTVGEVVAFHERTNGDHRFHRFKNRNWHMFPKTGPAVPPKHMSYNGLPSTWQRLFVRNNEL